jgi:hypothetical protein
MALVQVFFSSLPLVSGSSAVGQHIFWAFVRHRPRVASVPLCFRCVLLFLHFFFVFRRLLCCFDCYQQPRRCFARALPFGTGAFCCSLPFFSYIRLLFRFLPCVVAGCTERPTKSCRSLEHDIVSTQQFDILKLEQVLY